MINSKDTLKELGDAVRSSNSGYQAMLRARLESKANDLAVTAAPKYWFRPLFLTTSAFAALILVVVTWPKPPADVVYSPGTPPSSIIDTNGLLEESLDTTGALGSGRTETSDIDYFYAAPSSISKGEIIDYENENGPMLATSTTITLWSTDSGLVTEVQELFSSLGGHVSSIQTYSITQPTTLTGLVPADSYFMFREQLRELAKHDKYLAEVLNATDLIPSAITLDESIAEVTEAIEVLKAEIAKTENKDTLAALRAQLSQRETQLENLRESREGLDGQVEYVSVSVAVTEIASFWETREVYDLHRLVAGIEHPVSLTQRALINVLIVCFYALQVLSVTFWLLIPLAIWLISRRRQRRVWKELD
jgi:molybdopterin converting factor small subunit